MQSIGSVMVIGMNKILYTFSSSAQAVFGIYFKLQSFFFMPVFGLNNGVVPIIAYNFGAGRQDRMKKTIRTAAVYAVAIMLIGIMIMEIIPDKLLCFSTLTLDRVLSACPRCASSACRSSSPDSA